MRRGGRCAAGAAAVLLLPALCGADDTFTRPPMRRLELGLYGRVHPPSQALPLPRFEDSVEVTAEPPRDLDAAMAVHWRQWNLSTGSIYGRGIAFQNQGCPTCVNVLPLLGKIVDAIKKKK